MKIEDLSGANVVIFDDTPREVKSIRDKLEKDNISTEFVNVDVAGQERHLNIIQAVRLVFLDLTYNTGYNSEFDPDFCVQLISEVVPKAKRYYLVIWTKDIDNAEEVIIRLKENDLAPITYTAKRKEDYRIGEDEYDVDRLFDELDKEFDDIKDVSEFIGEIIDIEEKAILVNCLLDEDNGVTQIRRFDKAPFGNFAKLAIGNFVAIRIITKPGSRVWEFNEVSGDFTNLFKKPNYFEGLDTASFFKVKNKDNESNV